MAPGVVHISGSGALCPDGSTADSFFGTMGHVSLHQE